jgi:hypothetical protein
VRNLCGTRLSVHFQMNPKAHPVTRKMVLDFLPGVKAAGSSEWPATFSIVEVLSEWSYTFTTLSVIHLLLSLLYIYYSLMHLLLSLLYTYYSLCYTFSTLSVIHLLLSMLFIYYSLLYIYYSLCAFRERYKTKFIFCLHFYLIKRSVQFSLSGKVHSNSCRHFASVYPQSFNPL